MHGQPGPWSSAESQAIIDKGQAIIDSNQPTVTDRIVSTVDKIPPCWQLLTGIIEVGNAIAEAVGVGATTGGIGDIVLVIAAGDALAWQVTSGGVLIARGIQRIHDGKVDCWSGK
jgi:hypothetical protein